MTTKDPTFAYCHLQASLHSELHGLPRDSGGSLTCCLSVWLGEHLSPPRGTLFSDGTLSSEPHNVKMRTQAPKMETDAPRAAQPCRSWQPGPEAQHLSEAAGCKPPALETSDLRKGTEGCCLLCKFLPLGWRKLRKALPEMTTLLPWPSALL